MTNNKPKQRIFELDCLRGIAVIAMIFDHFTYLANESMYMAPYLFNNYLSVRTGWFNRFLNFCVNFQNSTFRNAGHYVFVTIFLALAGISSSFSKNNFKRSGKVFIGAALITTTMLIVSLVSGEDYHIIFGILHLIGTSILLFAVVQKIYPNKWLYLGIGVVLVIWGFLIKWYDAPYINNITDLNIFSIIEVIMGYKVYGSDHFGIIPCTGVFFIGAFLGETLYKNRKSLLPKLDKNWHRPFTFVGRHALIFYLLHQIVALIIIGILYLIAGYRF